MSKRTRSESKATKDGGAKRSQGPKKISENDWIEAINSTGITGCQEIQSKLENLLEQTKCRIANLKENAREQGLAYTGEDEVTCSCENTFESGGGYAATCDKCPDEKKKEQCTDCVKECAECCKNVCESCITICPGCDDSFCGECLIECCTCNEGFCDRSKDCVMVEIGYGGESSCQHCLER